MDYPEEELIGLLRAAGVNFTASLPCEKFRRLLDLVGKEFFHVPLTREEEGVGICAGAALAGRKPAIFVQSSGIGNMVNALLSLTGFYALPLAIFISQRGIYQERIEAQVPLGARLPKILRAAGIPFTSVRQRRDLSGVRRALQGLYEDGRVHAFLLSPALWESTPPVPPGHCPPPMPRQPRDRIGQERPVVPRFTRAQILEAVAPALSSRAVVCNLGIPSKELYATGHRPSYFYMLGSMGMVLPIGLGIALTTEKEVVVVEGDGSLLMNPGTLATTASLKPRNLTILCIDNGAYGSTGNQPTLTGSCVDLARVAEGFGIGHAAKVSGIRQIRALVGKKTRGLRFIHALALSGNRDVPNIPIHHLQNKRAFMEFLQEETKRRP